MTDVSLQETATTAKRSRGRPFAKGQSGNPGSRPRSSINRSTRAAQLLLDGEATALSRKAVELALAGDPTALLLCLDRTVAPRRDRSVELSRPPMTRAISTIACGNWRPRRRHAARSLWAERSLRSVRVLNGARPAEGRATLPIRRKTANRQPNCRCYCAPPRRSNPGSPRRSEADRSIFAAKNSKNSSERELHPIGETRK